MAIKIEDLKRYLVGAVDQVVSDFESLLEEFEGTQGTDAEKIKELEETIEDKDREIEELKEKNEILLEDLRKANE